MSKLVDQLKRHEGFRNRMYKDTVGKNTVGFGRNMDDVPITSTVAEMMLSEDVAVAYDAATQLDYWANLSPARQDVVTNMIFNMGLPRFMGFKNMNAALFLSDFDMAADEMMDSKWAVQVGDRARELSAQMRNGEYADG